ncbi:MAG: hypothetical protein Q9209_000077 [Squamulea sp. 1 TL-2023]
MSASTPAPEKVINISMSTYRDHGLSMILCRRCKPDDCCLSCEAEISKLNRFRADEAAIEGLFQRLQKTKTGASLGTMGDAAMRQVWLDEISKLESRAACWRKGMAEIDVEVMMF